MALTFGCGILSPLFLHDTITLILTPLTFSLTLSLGLTTIPDIVAVAGATNIGSVATLSSNPQNILIGSFSQIPYLEFLRILAPIAFTGQRWYKGSVKMWGYDLRNQLVANIASNQAREYIVFTNGKKLLVETAWRWGWERVLNYATTE
ncbi:hypothetical protein FJR38_06110 [Anabaena sp. UHCC 0253]|uniref:SLC13 family permease n=1 Tax=Anabaena sp. UHCC 0253 TaxID=2590019 RepID=UPI0014457159|nr:SLC13 family permease [Anabaena sp. UHCC 0253]MTJ52272.1 hypothetical protein [Anabaena sp. UHCC 0253]